MLYLASDHAGYPLKEKIKKFLSKKGVTFEDLGTHTDEAVDYSDYALLLGKKVALKPSIHRGVLFCGNGVGVCIAANKVKGVRAALIYDDLSAKQASEHSNSNVACFGSRTMKVSDVKKHLWTWRSTPFSGEARHVRRIRKITDFENGKKTR